jgi:hypothetical protein
MGKKKRARRSAIVPAMVLSASLAGGVCVVPALVVGCNASGVPNMSVAADGFHGADGQPPDLLFIGVADVGFGVAADFARPPVGLDVAAADFSQPFSVAFQGFDLSGEG